MNFRQIVQDYFTFSRNERKGITILLVLIFLLAIANKIIFYFETPSEIDAELLNADFNQTGTTIKEENRHVSLFYFNPNTIDPIALDSLALPESIKKNLLRYREKGGHYYTTKDFKKMYGVTDSIFSSIEPYIKIETAVAKPVPGKMNKQLFNFDPNQSSDSVFIRLGFSEKQIQTIRHYQDKGGYFQDAEGFFKIYGITESQKRELQSYINIEKKDHCDLPARNEKKKLLIEINSTDSLELMLLPGIGTMLSKRIIKYRDLLGGYYTFEQLKEVYGLSEQTIIQIENMIKVDVSKIHKVDLNFSDPYELSKHPYIGKEIAKQIIAFRTRYGKISDASVLKDSLIIRQEDYERLKPYL